MKDVRLVTLNYSEFDGQDLAWTLNGLELGHINLLVGKNATGKSRAVAVIHNLARMLVNDEEKVTLEEGGFDIVLQDDEQTTYTYQLKIVDSKVLHEEFKVNGISKLSRDADKLKIKLEDAGQTVTYRPAASEVAAVARRDELQHPFLNPLHDWASTLRCYHFGSRLGKGNIQLVAERVSNTIRQAKFNDRDENQVVAIYQRGKREYQSEYDDLIIADMKRLGYNIIAIDVTEPANVRLETNIPAPTVLNAIAIKEEGINGWIPQTSISDGMFRALSIICQINYLRLANRASTILVDDIGEGLDFDRSSMLIEILREKALDRKFQLVMTTNDQFVMDRVPLEEWSVLQRNGANVVVKNHKNSQEQFEQFKFVGMSNFTFFEMDFINSKSVQEDNGGRTEQQHAE